MKRMGAALLTMSAVAGCATIIDGPTQELVVDTNPAGANCNINRQGNTIATVNPTPGSVTIDKTKHDIMVYCDKPGYQQATYLNHSGAAGSAFGNAILGGGIGWAFDSALGADNKYTSPMNITMVPIRPPPPVIGPPK